MSVNSSSAPAKRVFARTESSVMGPVVKKAKADSANEPDLMEVDLGEDVGSFIALAGESRKEGHAALNWGLLQTH